MNCFQIVSLTYWSQLQLAQSHSCHSCELLSDCIFDILVTTATFFFFLTWLLWIAFRLYLWHIGHNGLSGGHWWFIVVNCFQIVSLTYWSQLVVLLKPIKDVVNCFQIVSLTYWSQLRIIYYPNFVSCELLSDCIFDILVTT